MLQIERKGCFRQKRSPPALVYAGGERFIKRDSKTGLRLALIRNAADQGKELRKSHENPFVTQLYEQYLGSPNGHRSHELLHTRYVKRGMFNQLTPGDYSVAVEPAQQRKVMPKPRPRLFELEAENRRLTAELRDKDETVEILKSVIADCKP